MKTLFVNACIREDSRTRKIAEKFLNIYDPDYVECNLEEEGPRALTNGELTRRSELAMKGDFSDPYFRFARQFREAETLVIAGPYYDLSLPAAVKDYIETINIVGLTFHYIGDDAPRTLSKGKRLVYVMTAGGTVVSHEYGYGYLKTMFETFYEFEDCHYLYAEKLDLTGADVDAIMDKALTEAEELALTLKQDETV